MQNKRFVLTGCLLALITASILWTGCPTGAGTEETPGPTGPTGNFATVPEDVVVLAKSTSGYEIGGTAQDSTVNTAAAGPIGTWYAASSGAKDLASLSGVIVFEWNKVEGATDYEVFAGKADPDPAAVPVPPADGVTPTASTTNGKTFYFLRDVEGGAAYNVWIRAKNNKGAGPFGETPFTVTLAANKALQGTENGSASFSDGRVERADFPHNLTATVIEDGKVHLKWDNTDRAAWYEVYYAEEDIRIEIPSGNQWMDDYAKQYSLPYAPYRAVWDALVNDGTGESATAVSDRRLIPYQRIPEIQDVAVPWNDKAGAKGNVGEVHKIHALETTITGLDPAKKYWFWVRSLNSNGERGMGRNPLPTTYAVDIPGIVPSYEAPEVEEPEIDKPGNVAANPVLVNSVGGNLEISWNVVYGSTGYNVYLSKFDTFSSDLAPMATITNGTINKTIVRNLKENQVYYIWVVANGTDSIMSLPSDVITGTASISIGQPVIKVEKEAVWGERLKNFLYVEVNHTDPRVALGYELEETGEKFFDVVVIFAANLRTRDCNAELEAGNTGHFCNQKGPHIHLNGNVQHVLDNRDKYIKPLQDAGMKVVLGLLGDHDAFIYHSLGNWPYESAYPWSTPGNPGVAHHQAWYTGDPAVYPFTPGNGPNGIGPREEFFDSLQALIEKYGLDGFDVDDEWAYDNRTRGISVDTSVYGSTPTIYDAVMKNYAEFAYEMRKRLGDEAHISFYEWHSLERSISATAKANIGANGEEVLIKEYIYDILDSSGEASYGADTANSVLGMPRMKYSPFAIGFHNRTGSTNYARYLDAGKAGDPYGYLLWYDLLSLAAAKNSTVWGATRTQASHISQWSSRFFGQNVIYIGQDYPQDWVQY